MTEEGDTDEFNEAIKGFDIKSYEDLQVRTFKKSLIYRMSNVVWWDVRGDPRPPHSVVGIFGV